MICPNCGKFLYADMPTYEMPAIGVAPESKPFTPHTDLCDGRCDQRHPTVPPLSSPQSDTSAYAERDMVISLCMKLALSLGLSAGLALDMRAKEGFRHVVLIDLPGGQVSWHITDAEVPFYAVCGSLPAYRGQWDGHSTEEKYARVLHPMLEKLRG